MLRKPSMLLKVDLAKAFDTVSWPFCLLEVLEHLGFPARWRDWISAILSSSTTKVLVNGRPGKRIYHARGLRQGDLLSPLLFVLVMEVLNALLREADRRHQLAPLPGSAGPDLRTSLLGSAESLGSWSARRRTSAGWAFRTCGCLGLRSASGGSGCGAPTPGLCGPRCRPQRIGRSTQGSRTRFVSSSAMGAARFSGLTAGCPRGRSRNSPRRCSRRSGPGTASGLCGMPFSTTAGCATLAVASLRQLSLSTLFSGTCSLTYSWTPAPQTASSGSNPLQGNSPTPRHTPACSMAMPHSSAPRRFGRPRRRLR